MLTRLPQAHGDVGNRSEPLGPVALFVEGGVIAIAGYALRPATLLPRRTTVTFAGAR